MLVTESSLAAVLWDMDGTLIDSEPYWMSAEVELVAEYGGQWTHEDALQLVGNGMEHSALILQSRGVRLTTGEIIRRLTGEVVAQVEHRVPWRPGALELLRSVRAAGIPTALVTMSPPALATRVAAAADAFDTVVSGEDTPNPKPHPDPYLEAMRRLEVEPCGCVAIEDSEPGLAAAVASGAAAIAVPVHVPISPSPAYTMWADGLVGRSVDDLVAVLATRRTA